MPKVVLTAKPLSVITFLCTILPCIGLQELDDQSVWQSLDEVPGYKEKFIGPREEYRSAHSSQGRHIGAENVQQRQQTRLDHITWQNSVRRHVETSGGAFVGNFPDHVLEHLAES